MIYEYQFNRVLVNSNLKNKKDSLPKGAFFYDNPYESPTCDERIEQNLLLAFISYKRKVANVNTIFCSIAFAAGFILGCWVGRKLMLRKMKQLSDSLKQRSDALAKALSENQPPNQKK